MTHLATRVVETHISRLFFVDDRVVKVKLPVVTAFADFSTRAARRAACEREVELNRRLAPDVYLGVMDMTLDGECVEHAVLMVRLPEERRLSARLDEPDVAGELHAVAERVAALHAAAPRGPEIDRVATRAAVAELWEQGVDQLQPFSGTVLAADRIDRLDQLAREYLTGRDALFDERIRRGAICDGHGDLQAEDIFCLDDGPRILDCLEFDDRLRFGDVLNDVAFLAMDLGRLGHPELGERFVAEYRRLSGDRWPDSLARHYMAYRAHVRSKVACLRHSRGDDAAAASARELHTTAVRHLEAARLRMVLVGGLPGTGKSTVSRPLAERLGGHRVSSDEVRDELFPRSDDRTTGRYDPVAIDAVYAELLRRATTHLGMGEHVVLDASWLHERHRSAAREVAERTGAVLVELCCSCPTEVAEDRIERRALTGADASEATVEVARSLATSADPWPQASTIDTVVPVVDTVSAALRRIDERVRS